MGANRYYNPPAEVPTVGRSLRSGTYTELHAQLQPGEVLIAVFDNQAPALVAAEVPSQDRLDELDRLWLPSSFFAVPQAAAEVGFGRV